MGASVAFHAELTGVNKRRVQFTVRTLMGETVIGEGSHERAIIDVEHFGDQVRSQ